MKHAPTPWVAQEGTDGAWFIWNQNGGISTKDLITSCVGRVNPGYRDAGQAKADAEFIVRACNAHDAMLQASKKVVEILRDHAEFSDNANEASAIDEMDRAIALAEVGQ